MKVIPVTVPYSKGMKADQEIKFFFRSITTSDRQELDRCLIGSDPKRHDLPPY